MLSIHPPQLDTKLSRHTAHLPTVFTFLVKCSIIKCKIICAYSVIYAFLSRNECPLLSVSVAMVKMAFDKLFGITCMGFPLSQRKQRGGLRWERGPSLLVDINLPVLFCICLLIYCVLETSSRYFIAWGRPANGSHPQFKILYMGPQSQASYSGIWCRKSLQAHPLLSGGAGKEGKTSATAKWITKKHPKK